MKDAMWKRSAQVAASDWLTPYSDKADRRPGLEGAEETRRRRQRHENDDDSLHDERGGERHVHADGEEREPEGERLHQPVRQRPAEDGDEVSRRAQHAQPFGESRQHLGAAPLDGRGDASGDAAQMLE